MRMNKFPTHLELLTSVSVEISAFRGNTYLYILFPYFLSNRMFPARVRTRPKPGCFPRKRGQLEGGVPESGGRSLSFDRNGMCRRADEQTNRATTRQAQPSRDRPELWYTQTVNQHRKRVSPKDCFETVPETKSTPTCILGILGGPWHDSVRLGAYATRDPAHPPPPQKTGKISMPARRRPSKKASSCLDNYNDDQQRRMAARPDGSHRRWNKRNIAYGAALIATLLIVAVVLLAVLLPDTNHDSNTGSTTTTTTTTTNDASTAAPRWLPNIFGADAAIQCPILSGDGGTFVLRALHNDPHCQPLAATVARNKHSTGNYRVHNQQTRTMYSLLVFLSFLFAYTCIQTKPPPRRNITTMGTFELLETVPHDANAFTQGLQSVPDDRTTTASTTSTTSKMYESTGLYGASDVRIVDVATGGVLLKTELQSQFFGEGLTYYVDSLAQEGRLVQLTWKEQTGFVYDPTTLVQLSNFTYKTSNTEGWGITYRADQNIFYVTDGSTFVHTWNVEFQEIAKVPVTMQNTATSNPSTLNLINELEWDVNSRTLLANVWMQDVLIRIQPETGFVTTVYDLTTLFLNRPNSADVLNGIALTDVPDELWVTGKLWPNMYRIRLIG
ncbi:predicted protein [Phaeodactylum tricornutum CCAP 1055/1]|uniref:Glutamine cyclotransferase n=2 Tax=Phaeodactylum tricornutum TaxID=2850 RepID=B5Y5L7_PHATC|nr:predicted protein [Phaeodactylum tricornutum CCAP 1055/1]ACI65960.1 predicted protein [Phaeodactylum tricornutum CCAP 1055/1]|eukprot:XP_002186490.1 predicted protein [Phaeodactylum tricornutum CCAP 1055/1]